MLEEMFDGNSRQSLNERPYSRTQSAIDSAKGKVKGVFGSGQIEQGAAEVGAEANKLWMDFKRYIGRKYGAAQQTVPYSDAAEFFAGNKLDTKFLGSNTRRSFTPQDIGKAILAGVREYMNEFGSDDDKQGQQPPAGNSQSGGPQPQSQPSTQQPPANQPAQSGGLGNLLASLSAAEREQLLRLLS